jgi:hypothetical protein
MVSQVLTLYLTPVVYLYFERAKQALSKRPERPEKVEAALQAGG